MDNATAEYTFVTSFFAAEASVSPLSAKDTLFSPTAMLTPVKGGFDDRRSVAGSEVGGQTSRTRADSLAPYTPTRAIMKADRVPLDAIWKQIMDPVLEYCQVDDTISPLFCCRPLTRH